ncbi:MarR family winged helix-turn-helix transcriptional regulator [Demequina sp. SYSU T00192]|uniref:MarR family winged helix-turn-helix transcriptional regulator n=1 Tax=Demequina litoralis TaxID=3051660 RepID=A0ABT8GB13_9MICO|nr:MarR family winged helix-turn-helix transcriptional regulator [Demequina sp. SYSU T00192]MDN4476330.1 MarR family winged helix-turn-helix transcriptional regulator [Demequina sp. SYSU T00192]
MDGGTTMAQADDARLAAVLRDLSWTVHKRTPARAGVGPLPTTEIALLKQVVEQPGSTVGELSAALGLRQPNASAALRVLTQRGLVAREVGAPDRRIVRIQPTPAGVEEHHEISRAWVRSVEDAIAQLDPADRATLEGATDAMLALTRLVRTAE